jgi:hypothetical protein
MRSGLVVVGDIGPENLVETVLSEVDDAVEVFSTYRAHKAFCMRVPPRTPRCGEHLLDGHALDPVAEAVAVDAVAIADDVPGCCVLGEGLDDLLGGRGRQDAR